MMVCLCYKWIKLARLTLNPIRLPTGPVVLKHCPINVQVVAKLVLLAEELVTVIEHPAWTQFASYLTLLLHMNWYLFEASSVSLVDSRLVCYRCLVERHTDISRLFPAIALGDIFHCLRGHIAHSPTSCSLRHQLLETGFIAPA